jgi:hypothetical protein
LFEVSFMSSSILFAAVQGLVRDDSRFVSALRSGDSVAAAIAGALATVDGDAVRNLQDGASDAVGALEALLRRRLDDARIGGELPDLPETEDLAAFYASVVLGLLGKLLNESSERTLSAIRLSAMKVLPRPPGN